MLLGLLVRTFLSNSGPLVIGVDETDFTFTASDVSGAAITNIAGSGTTWTVTVSTGSGARAGRVEWCSLSSLPPQVRASS